MTPLLRAKNRMVVASCLFGTLLLYGCQPTNPPGTGGSSVDTCDNPPCEPTDNGNKNDNDGPPIVAGGDAPNDLCVNASEIEGPVEVSYDLTMSTTDGPAHAACSNQGADQIDNDVWYCWTADCDGVAIAHTCELTDVDTRIAIYQGCECPPSDARLLTCADDGCGVQTRAAFNVVAGASYLVRLGMFPPTDAGPGSIEIRCGFAACPSEGSCDAGRDAPGCADANCCNTVCAVDSMCCEEVWDDWCASEAAGLCNGGFSTCATGDSCTAVHETGGCADEACCHDVCSIDPYCCLTQWDETCVELEAVTCFSTCTAAGGPCDAAHGSPGCNDRACCAEVCPRDSFCCMTEWDEGCTLLAAEVCD